MCDLSPLFLQYHHTKTEECFHSNQRREN